MNRTKPIAALEKAQKYAASLNNPSVEAFKAQGGKSHRHVRPGSSV